MRTQCVGGSVPVCMEEEDISPVPREMVTVEEYETWVAEAEGPAVALLQVGSEACQRCPAFKRAVKVCPLHVYTQLHTHTG